MADQTTVVLSQPTVFSRDEFLQMVNRNLMPYRQLMSFYKCAAMEVETKFRVLDEEMSLQNDRNPIESIKTRIKTVDSLVRKINRRGLPLDIAAIEENIHDIAGVRVICSFPEDIFFLEKCLLKQDDVVLLQRKDYITNPKPGGYRSLHLIIEVPIFLQDNKRMTKVEVQLRTIAMDFWASLEHKLRYKKDLDPELQEKLRQKLLDCSNASAELDRRMEAVRKEIEEATK